MNPDIQIYNNSQSSSDQEICENLPEAENKIWHRHPVWFLDGNPIVGFTKQKKGIRLMFWSGESFDEKKLLSGTGKFKDASIFNNNLSEIEINDLKKWCNKAQKIQWDYKNIVKIKGVLEKL